MKYLVLCFLTFSVFGFSQDVKMKKGVITIDDKEWAKYEGCGMFDFDCSFFKKDQEISIFSHRIVDPSEKRPSNPEGSVSWCEVKFLGTKQSFEIQETPKFIAKILYKSKVFNEDGTFNEEKINVLVEKYGNEYSTRYLKNSSQTIIINNNESTPAKSGINIKIGN